MEDVTACIVTRGDHDLTPIIHSLADAGFPLIKIWDNSKRERDLSVYGRYALIEETDSSLIYVQDDDCVVSDPAEIVRVWRNINLLQAAEHNVLNWHVVCNQPAPFRHGFYEEHSLVGFGAVFHRAAPRRAFDLFEKGCGVTTYLAEEPEFRRERQGEAIVQSNSPHMKYVQGRGWLTVADFQRTCDVVFTALTPRVLVDVPYKNLPWAEDPDRMYRQPGHQAERGTMLELAFRARDAMV